MHRHTRHRQVMVHLGHPVDALGHRGVETVHVDHGIGLPPQPHRRPKRSSEVGGRAEVPLVKGQEVALCIRFPGSWRPVKLSGLTFRRDRDVVAQEIRLIRPCETEAILARRPGRADKDRFWRCPVKARRSGGELSPWGAARQHQCKRHPTHVRLHYNHRDRPLRTRRRQAILTWTAIPCRR